MLVQLQGTNSEQDTKNGSTKHHTIL